MTKSMIQRVMIRLTGRVQGVGFRPAVYRLAVGLGLTGRVQNNNQGLAIELQGPADAIGQFVQRLQSNDRPPLAAIETISIQGLQPIPDEAGFVIEPSDDRGLPDCEVCPDMAVCSQCLDEMHSPGDLRYNYPFINCTNCGPRYSIIVKVPYDRPNTTMGRFRMCHTCESQYRNPMDRRFHAQPVACPDCGPRVWLVDPSGNVIRDQTMPAIAQAAQMLRSGRILAVKGIGGFHLMVDAANDQAVRTLRMRKKRDYKPFAMMARSVSQIRLHAVVDAAAEVILAGPQAPIVLLQKADNNGISASVAPGVGTFGFMVCYAPLHHLLLKDGPAVVVATSGNISDEPLICDNREALIRLAGLADGFLMHDRPIYRQVDDSVVHIVDGRPAMIRRARGYVPTPIIAAQQAPVETLALGADLKNTFCLARAEQLICSEHMGDLGDAEVFRHYIESINQLQGLMQARPEVLVCDLHPGYISSSYASQIAKGFKRLIKVQHHWAHIASVIAEHRLEGPVIGIVADGTGYGTDGAIWGCECLIADLKGFERAGQLRYYRLPGGDKAAREAIRPLMGLLGQIYGPNLDDYDWILERIEPDMAYRQLIARQLARSVNTVATSSLGRVFDAISAILGLGKINHFDAQLPMALEAIIYRDVTDHYPFRLVSEDGIIKLDIAPCIDAILRQVREGVAAGLISTRFHNTIACGLSDMAHVISQKTGIRTVAISGGVFCNKYLIERLIGLLRQDNLVVYWNQQVPSNDAGISLGQAAIASAMVSCS